MSTDIQKVAPWLEWNYTGLLYTDVQGKRGCCLRESIIDICDLYYHAARLAEHVKHEHYILLFLHGMMVGKLRGHIDHNIYLPWLSWEQEEEEQSNDELIASQQQ